MKLVNGHASLGPVSQRKVRATVDAQARSLVDVAKAHDQFVAEVERIGKLTNERLAQVEAFHAWLESLTLWGRLMVFVLGYARCAPHPFRVATPKLPEGWRGFWCAGCGGPIEGTPAIFRDPVNNANYPLCEECEVKPLGLERVASDEDAERLIAVARGEDVAPVKDDAETLPEGVKFDAVDRMFRCQCGAAWSAFPDAPRACPECAKSPSELLADKIVGRKVTE